MSYLLAAYAVVGLTLAGYAARLEARRRRLEAQLGHEPNDPGVGPDQRA